MIIQSCVPYTKDSIGVILHLTDMLGNNFPVVLIQEKKCVRLCADFNSYVVDCVSPFTLNLAQSQEVYAQFELTYRRHPHCDVFTIKRLSHC